MINLQDNFIEREDLIDAVHYMIIRAKVKDVILPNGEIIDLDQFDQNIDRQEIEDMIEEIENKYIEKRLAEFGL